MPQYFLVRMLAWLTQHMPVGLGYWVANRVGDCVYWTWRRGRESAIDNMRRVLGPRSSEREARRIARRSFRNYHKDMVDFLRLPRIDILKLNEQIHIEGLEYLEQALAAGKGALLVGSHFGNWDLAGLILASRGYAVNAIADSFGSKRLNEWIVSSRKQRGVHVIAPGVALRRIYQALKRNEIVGIILDRPAGEDGIPVPFFGETACWPTGPAAIALRTGAPVLAGYLLRQPDGKFYGCLQPVPGLGIDDREGMDVATATQAIVRALERHIQQWPEQWYMFRRMWPQPVQPNPKRGRGWQRWRLRVRRSAW